MQSTLFCDKLPIIKKQEISIFEMQYVKSASNQCFKRLGTF